MNGSHNRDRALSIGHRAVGGQRHILAGALEASPEIAPEASMINNSLQRYWMKRLQEQRSYGTDEHRRIGVYPPDRILFTEPTLAVPPDLGMLRLEVARKAFPDGLGDGRTRVGECRDRHKRSVRAVESPLPKISRSDLADIGNDDPHHDIDHQTCSAEHGQQQEQHPDQRRVDVEIVG